MLKPKRLAAWLLLSLVTLVTLAPAPASAQASAGVNVCDRTAQVRDEIVRQSSATECTSITDLATITRLDLFRQRIASLQPGDFAGLSALQTLNLRENALQALPATIFAGLTALQALHLTDNALQALPATIFDGLTALQALHLTDNALEALPATIFDGLGRLSDLRMVDNPFTADTGLPAGIFDDVLDTLGAITTNRLRLGFVIDQPVRDAHFVCSHAGSASIVMMTTGVTDCLRISSAQFNTAIPLVDATLSGLTLSDGTDPLPLTPVFASGTTTYPVAVANSVTSVTVTPTATRSGATITVNSAAVTSGSASNAINLMPDVAVPITIVVTAADGATTATYTVMVARAAPGLAATLTGSLTEATLSPPRRRPSPSRCSTPHTRRPRAP